MSSSSSSGPSQTQTADPSSSFKSMLDDALVEYKKKTGEDLQTLWLASELQTCESVDSVLDILREQAKAFERSGDRKLIKWIDPLVHVLYTFSGALGDGISVPFPPAKVIFTGIGVLLGAAKDVRASHGAIIDLFERIESFFKRLEVYTEISLTTKMAEVLVKIVIELLSILSIATKEVRRRRAKLFARKLLGMTDIEDALRRLDSLIQEEFRMATAQILKVTTEIAADVKDGADKAHIAMQQILNDVDEVKCGFVEVKRDVGEVKCNVEEAKWTQIEQEIYSWFSPPDPYTNYNIACRAHSEGTAAWFFQSSTFKGWMSIGSLLWIHGKPGSGKSIICSTIIKHVISLRDTEKASLAFFYFDFRDEEKKQDFGNFVKSVLVQLSACSSSCCEIIFRMYTAHEKGKQQPSNDALTKCLREMLSVAAHQPVYLIVDALDECPDSSGMPTPREDVLNLLEGLVRLELPKLRICVTSRPEVDIKDALDPLASGTLSLHNEHGQMKDIFDYVSKVVHSDKKMRRWRSDQKELVVKELSNKVDGMFRWVFCQLEVLRHCLPASIRQTLDQLPESLDETYIRVLRQIPRTNQAHAHRMLQCLLVAVRPLRVEELAELLAFDFDAVQGGIPQYRAAMRLDDQTQAVLSTCSSLVTIVDTWYGGRIVQFSHFSVKEFLMSSRLGDFSRYYIHPVSAQIILAQACLGVLLHLGGHVGDSPLVEYAAEHWVGHAQFEGVASHVQDGMEILFDSDKPHFVAWIGLYDIDTPNNYWPRPKPRSSFLHFSRNPPNPLYYSVLCGFYQLVRHLAIKHPQYVNAICGRYRCPLFAALSEEYIEVAELLLEHGASVVSWETTGETILLKVLSQSQRDLVHKVKLLLKHGTDVNVCLLDGTLRSSLHIAEGTGELEVARILVEHHADVNSQRNDGKTPLHILSEHVNHNEGDVLLHALLLLNHGAEVNIRDNDNDTSLHMAIRRDRFELAGILLEHGADANAENNEVMTPLHVLSEGWIEDELDAHNLALLLLKQGAGVNSRNRENETPLHLAIRWDQFKLTGILLEHGADANAENNDGMTPWHILSESQIGDLSDAYNLVQLLLKHGVEVNSRDKNNDTLLHLAIRQDQFKLVRILLEHNADTNVENNEAMTPLHVLSEGWIEDEGDACDLVDLLLQHGAEVNSRARDNDTPLHLAIRWAQVKLAAILLKHGADPNAENTNGMAPWHILLKPISGT